MDKRTQFLIEDAHTTIDLSDLDGKRVLISGASGLLGHYLLATLAGARKKGLNTSVSALLHHQPEPYFQELLQLAGGTAFVGDVTDEQFTATLPESDAVIHAAGYGQPGRFMEDPVKTILLNTIGTYHLLERTLEGGSFLFVSTSEIYSGATTLPYSEKTVGATMPTHPRACYIEGKRCGETITLAYSRRPIKRTIARLCLAYGPGTRPHDQRVLNQFIEKGLIGEIKLLDSGTGMRTYCYITDAVALLLKMLLSGTQPVYNLGGHSRTSIRDLAKQIGQLMHVPVMVPPVSQTMEGAPDDVSLDMTLAETEFSKDNVIDLESGLKRTIEWQRLIYADKT